MKNKRKIWVRLGAFMAALICCVLCVVPAYAESGEGLNTIAEQENYINRLIEPLGVQLDLAAYIGDSDLLYSDMWYYGFMNETDTLDGKILTPYGNSSGSYTTYIGGHLIANVYASAVYEWGFSYNRVQLNMYSGGGGSVSWSGDGNSLTLLYDATTHLPIRCDYYSSLSGSITINIGNDVTLDIQAYAFERSALTGFFPFGVVIQPRQLLQLELPEGGYTLADLEAAWEAGHTEGYTNGKDQGYRIGYDDGMHQTSLIEGIKSLFRAPMEFIESVLDFEIFGIDLGDAVKALVSMMLLALVITVVWKAVK